MSLLINGIREAIFAQEKQQISQEAIAFQGNSKLSEGLTDLFTKMRASQLTTRDARVKVEKLVFDETGIYTDFVIESTDFHNAFAIIPSLSPNHPFFIEMEKDYRKENYDLAAKDSIDIIKRKVRNIGYVDLNTSRVGGAFSEIKVVSGVYSGLLYDEEFTAAEVTAAYLHELGHVFTTFEMAANFIVDNYALMALTQSLINAENKSTKVQILRNAHDYLGVADNEINEIANVTDSNLLMTILMDAKVRTVRYGNKAKHYNLNGQEFLADQFATRHGSGRALVTLNDKLHRLYKVDEERTSSGERIATMLTSLLAFGISAAITTIGFMTGGIFIMLIGGLFTYAFVASIFTNPLSGEEYDKPSDRFKRIRNELATELKNVNISPERKKVLITDIKAIDELVSDMTPYFTLWEKIGLLLFSSHRKTLDLRNTEQQLEKIGANDLFVKAAEFSIA